MLDSPEARFAKEWLPQLDRIELKLDALLMSVIGGQDRYDWLVQERFPHITFRDKTVAGESD